MGKHTLAILALLCYMVVGLFIYDDYGISWDEPIQREYGEAVFNYVFDNDTVLHTHPSKYHGPAFQMMLFGVEQVTGTKEITFKVRHLITFLFSIIGLWCFYRLLLSLKFSRYWAVLGMLFLILSPRIFAHSFYNSKDAVFMYMFIICMYALIQFLRTPKLTTSIFLAVLSGILIDIRILGFFIPMFLIGFWALRSVSDLDYGKRTYGLLALTGLATVVVIIAFWPTLWQRPMPELINALTKMGDYPWDDPVLFDGSFQLPKDLPWYYLPKWVFISSPIAISAFSILGVSAWFFGRKLDLWEKLIPVVWLVPLGIIILKGATVYDGWRHVFFLYPAIIIFATSGAKLVFGNWNQLQVAKSIPAALLIFPLIFIMKSHPHQQVYFNALYSNNAWSTYEMDYWGLSYKQALEHVVATQPEGDLKLSVANAPGFFNHYCLSKTDRDRIDWVSRDSADFFISNYRFPNEFQAFTNRSGPYKKPLKIIEVDGNPLVGVFDLTD